MTSLTRDLSRVVIDFVVVAISNLKSDRISGKKIISVSDSVYVSVFLTLINTSKFSQLKSS